MLLDTLCTFYYVPQEIFLCRANDPTTKEKYCINRITLKKKLYKSYYAQC